MIGDLELLNLQSPVGKGQENDPSDVEALDDRLRKIGAYSPPLEYADNPQRYATEPMIGSLERYQEQNGLKVDGVVKPGGPTERAINNHLLEKPRGAGLLHDPPTALLGRVGNGFENRPSDVVSVKRKLGALGYGPEDPFDRPSEFIEETTTSNVEAFQRAKGLTEDGWLGPRGETERMLDAAIQDLARAKGREWLAYGQRASAMPTMPPQANYAAPSEVTESSEVTPAYYDPRPYPMGNTMRPQLEGGWFPGLGGGPGGRGLGSTPSPKGPPNKPVPPVPSPENQRERAPQTSRRDDPDFHIPQPGSPLRIPLVDHHFGRPGDPRSVQTTKDAVDAIEKECVPLLKEFGASFKKLFEEYYPRRDGIRGGSFADGLFRIKIGSLTIDFVADTYTAKADATPNAREDGRYLKFKKNIKTHTFVIRVPKAWQMGQSIDKEKLSEATKEICEQIKNMVERGEFPSGNEKAFMDELLDKLVKPKRKPPEEPPSTEPRP